MIPRGSESRAGTPITLVAIHTAEGATTAPALRNYLDQPGVEASYHKIVDDFQVITYLPDYLAAWAMLSGNHRSLQLCFTGFASWSRITWLAHERMLRIAAIEVALWCEIHNIPIVKLSPVQVGANQSGIMGHWDWTVGKRDGTHTDPGVNFPWDVFIQYVQEADLNVDQDRKLTAVYNEVTAMRHSSANAQTTFAATGMEYAKNADGFGWRNEQAMAALNARIDDLTKTVNTMAALIVEMSKAK